MMNRRINTNVIGIAVGIVILVVGVSILQVKHEQNKTMLKNYINSSISKVLEDMIDV